MIWELRTGTLVGDRRDDMGTSDGGAETETIDYNLRKRYNPVKNSINRNQETGKIRKTACESQ